jgi:glycosyltransferase involved in cell wall biosynthesis
MKSNIKLNIGFWVPRPSRGTILAEKLRQKGHKVIIYHFNPINGEEENVKQINYGIKHTLELLNTRHDIYYTAHTFVPAVQLAINKLIKNKPFIFNPGGVIWEYYKERSNNSKFNLLKSSIYPKILNLILNKADSIIGNSKFLAGKFIEKYPQYQNKITSIYNGINYETIDSGKPISNLWPKSKIKILSVLTLNFNNKTDGAILLIKAFEELCERNLDASYLIAAKSSNIKILNNIKLIIKKSKFKDKILLLENRTDIPNILKSADLFLYATPENSSDSLPRSLLEAQAAGIPSITTNTTGCNEIINHNQNGLIVQYNKSEIAKASLKLIKDPTKSLEMANNAYKNVRKKFNWDDMANNYEKKFLEISEKYHKY